MNEIKVVSSVVVKVNEEGDTIVIHVEDAMFTDKFYSMIDTFDRVAKEINTEDVKKLSNREQLRFSIEKIKEIMINIDELFGEGCSRKVFGEIVPSPYIITDFFEQLIPIFEEYADERQKKIADKYNKGRKGARSKYRSKEELIQEQTGCQYA